MRRLTDADLLGKLMRRLGQEAASDGRVYFTGGATALLLGWRSTTIDVDLMLEGGAEQILKAFPRLKEDLQINVELASPAEFIPEVPGWRERCLYIRREGRLDFFHYDLYAQALAKIERGHALDVADVQEMLKRKLVDPSLVTSLFDEIKPWLYRYPAIDPPTFQRRLEQMLASG